jgi:hypothetical protein
MKRVPMFMPSAPSASAATSDRPSAMPPDATNGIVSSSAARGSRNEVRHIVFAGMAAALEAVDADRVAADRLRLQRVRDRGAFVDHLDAGILEGGSHFCGLLPAVSTIVTPPSMIART